MASSSLIGGAKHFAGQHRSAVRVGLIGAVLLAIVAFFMLHSAGQAPEHIAPTITMVVIQPPKPPPPPPPLPQPKMITPPKMTTPVEKPIVNQPPKAAPPKPAAPAAIPMGTSIHNNGPADSFNLNGTPGGNGFLGGGGGGGDAQAYFQEQLQTQIESALQANRVTRNASAGLEVRIWMNANGDVTQVSLVKSSGNPQIDDAVENQVLAHFRASYPPPPGTPMPVVMSLTGQQSLQ